MKCLINQLASEDRFLHQMAIRTSDTIVGHVRKYPTHAVEILKSLFMPPFGLVSFDHVAKKKTKIISSILQQVPEGNLEVLPDMYQDLISCPGGHDEKAADSRRQSAFDQVSSLIKSCQKIDTSCYDNSSTNVSFVKKALEMFGCLGYFSYKGTERTINPPLSNRSQDEARTRIVSCLSHLMNAASDPTFFPMVVIEKIHDGERSMPGWECIVEHDAAMDAAYAKLKAIKNNSAMKPFKLLFSLTLLEVYNGDADAMSMLDELEQCYNDINQIPGSKDIQDGHHRSSETLVEIILSFIAKPSRLFRRMAQQVFTASAPSLTEYGMHSMLKILDTRETLNGQAKIFDDREADAVDSIVSSNEDVEMLDDMAEDDDAESSASSAISNDSSGEDEKDDGNGDRDDAELEAFDAKLAQALGTRLLRVNSSSQANEHHHPADETSSESSDSDMTDSQMQAIDEHLSAVFRERKAAASAAKSKKAEKRDAKDTIVNFKIRVLELIEIYLKKEPSNPIALGVLIPLLRCIRMTQSPRVSKRACQVIKQYSKASKGRKRSSMYSLNIDTLKAVHAEAMLGGSNAFGAACSLASLIVVRIMKEHGATISDIADVYNDSMKRHSTDPSCKVNPVLFADWTQWCTSIGANV